SSANQEARATAPSLRSAAGEQHQTMIRIVHPSSRLCATKHTYKSTKKCARMSLQTPVSHCILRFATETSLVDWQLRARKGHRCRKISNLHDVSEIALLSREIAFFRPIARR